MPTTYPNQRTVHVNRIHPTSDFLGIKNDNWKTAARDLGAHAFLLYIYIASNANGYDLALSPAAIEAEIGMPRSTYHDQFRKLVNYGYLVEAHGHTYEFYETPHTSNVIQDKNERTFDVQASTFLVDSSTAANTISTPENTEINIYNTNIKNIAPNEKQASPSSQFVF